RLKQRSSAWLYLIIAGGLGLCLVVSAIIFLVKAQQQPQPVQPAVAAHDPRDKEWEAEDPLSFHRAKLKRPDEESRLNSVKALTRMGPKAEPALPELLAALNEAAPKNLEVYDSCLKAIG